MHAWHADGETSVALTVENAEVERLAAEVPDITGEAKTQAIRVALEERRRGLASKVDGQARAHEIRQWLQAGRPARVT
jgi:hypothetical protein